MKHFCLRPAKLQRKAEQAKMSRYKVTADDNFHPGSEADRSEYGTFATAEAALDECRAIVDDSLLWEYRDGATAQELYERYADFGDSPFVVALEGAPTVDFPVKTYARQRAEDFTASGGAGAQLRQTLAERKERRQSTRMRRLSPD